jgi:hypothetical protein
MNMKKWTLTTKTNQIQTVFLTMACLLFLAVIAKDTFSLSSEDKHRESGINATIAEYEPAVALRASGCLTCHAEIASNYITDFGYGSSYFFAHPASENEVGIFNGHIYGDFIADPGKTGWLTATFEKEIIVPDAPVDFDLAKAGGDTLPDEPSYQEALKAGSLAEYLRALESKKDKPAPVIEKGKIFIGAPDTATLEARFGIQSDDHVDFQYIKNDPTSPEVKGIELSKDGKYYTNAGEIICDGDLFIHGILFLNKPTIMTKTGCRIYATGPVFLQKEITFKNSGNHDDKSNLQLVSTEAIFLGVGREKRDATPKTDPMALRLLKTPARPSIFTRTTYGHHITPQEFTQDLYDKAALVPLEDSSYHDDTIGFSRLLLNAPVINSRYKGKFKGLVIAEYALFWPGKTHFEFDPIFKEVPVLPLLKDSDYLRIE